MANKTIDELMIEFLDSPLFEAMIDAKERIVYEAMAKHYHEGLVAAGPNFQDVLMKGYNEQNRLLCSPDIPRSLV